MSAGVRRRLPVVLAGSITGAVVVALDGTVLTVAQPTVAAAKAVREGLHEAAAGLRGYMAVGGERFRDQRARGCQNARQNVEALDRLTADASADERELLAQIGRDQLRRISLKANRTDIAAGANRLTGASVRRLDQA